MCVFNNFKIEDFRVYKIGINFAKLFFFYVKTESLHTLKFLLMINDG